MEQTEVKLPDRVAPSSRSKLGRGLNALMGIADAPSPPVPGLDSKSAGSDAVDQGEEILVELHPGSVTVNPFQPRREFDAVAIQELSQSIIANGLIQPIVVAKIGETYQLIAGERRLRAARLAGLSSIKAIVRQADPATQARLALVENIHREDLNPLERAESYRALLSSAGCTQAELAATLGEQRSTVANYLRLLELSDGVRAHLLSGRLTFGHAKVLAGVAAERQEELASDCIQQNWSVRDLEKACQSPTAPPHRSPPTPSAHLADLAKQLSHSLGLRVQVQRGGKKGAGRVVLHYGSLEEFDGLLKKLDVKLVEE